MQKQSSFIHRKLVTAKELENKNATLLCEQACSYPLMKQLQINELGWQFTKS
jgi:hypothetical protein